MKGRVFERGKEREREYREKQMRRKEKGNGRREKVKGELGKKKEEEGNFLKIILKMIKNLILKICAAHVSRLFNSLMRELGVKKAGPSGEGNGHPLQYSCLQNSMDKGAWRATVHGVTKSQIRLSNQACMHIPQTHLHICFANIWHCLQQ